MKTRNRSLIALLGFALSIPAWGAPHASADGDHPPASQPPNVLLILSDDQGWNDYGFMGHPAIETPHLDRLAAESLLFTRGYVTAPLCCPSLASIITGLHPHEHRITSNDPLLPDGEKYTVVTKWSDERREYRTRVTRHFETLVTMPELLSKVGYASLQTGKWWMGNYRTGGFTQGMTHGDMSRGGRHGDEGLKIGRETMQPIDDFLDQNGDRPFLIWYAPLLPHDPFNPPERLEKNYLRKTDSTHLARYWANCEWFDETCGEVLAALKTRGLEDRTIVIYVCDNGWIQARDHRLNAPRSKASPYEGGVRTPIMVKWPGHVHPGRDNTTLVSSLDIAPTILHACGVRPPKNLSGINLLDSKALQARNAVFGANYTHDYVDFDHPASSLKQNYVVAGEWKLIWHSGQNGTDEKFELFHILDDPEEKTDLAEKKPEKVEQLKKLIMEWRGWTELGGKQ